MLPKLGPRLPSHATVVAYLGLFVALGGTAYAVNTVGSADIIDGEVKSVDIGNNEVGSADVKDNSINTFDVHSFVGADVVDGTLEDQDIGQGTFVHFTASIGVVPANGCLFKDLSGVNAQGDHLLLTPDWDDTDSSLVYDVQYRAASGTAVLNVCNPTNVDIADTTAHFNLLVIDAQ